jgi:glycosyltransferase involved in cell wall biosynthesis
VEVGHDEKLDGSTEDWTALRLTRRSTEGAPLKSDCIVTAMKVRNEILRLPYTLDYHRNIGVRHFYIVDNDSNDGTLEWLASQPDVTVFHSDLPLNESDAGARWYNFLLNSFGVGKWCLVIDADELFVFPECETTSLDRYAARLDDEGAEAVFSLMIDMYAKDAVPAIGYAPGHSFLRCCPYFDPEGYEFQTYDLEGITPRYMVRGGVRRRLFFDRGGDESPILNKVPLVKWRRGMEYWSGSHFLRPALTLSRSSGALLHFKFFADFLDRVEVEVERGVMFNAAMEYKRYRDRLQAVPELSLYGPQSVEYRDSEQLLRLGLLRGFDGTSTALKQG